MMSRTFGVPLISLAATFVMAHASRAEEFKPEPGFSLLFNGKDLDGWKLKKGGESLDGKMEAAGGRFKVQDGVLLLDPKVKGDVIIETAKEFSKNLTIRFDFKPGKGCNNDLFLRGAKFDIKKPDVKNLKEDEWNEFEIVLHGAKAEFKANGELQKTLAAKAVKSAFGIRAEFGQIEIRRLRFKEEP